MAISLQVLYPAGPGTRFDHAYYAETHMALVDKHLGPFLVSAQATKGLSGGPDKLPGFHAVFTAVFENQDKFRAAMAEAGPVLADISNYTDVEPQMLIGEVIG
ncbi:hypothetical protein GCM10011316_04950 [Roseibium aquae]|uniref:EthD domain-containing protein n=1 Tax=Roseibium aquae TaxID=1323746 RepID=A0A916TA97_9HYPH|nr:EthD family reductase [Roseibium aquae]GGB35832.1 hypothetical protein GCM10011316_04950 [Roseibium aquae]